jgi:hypothetical protein
MRIAQMKESDGCKKEQQTKRNGVERNKRSLSSLLVEIIFMA